MINIFYFASNKESHYVPSVDHYRINKFKYMHRRNAKYIQFGIFALIYVENCNFIRI